MRQVILELQKLRRRSHAMLLAQRVSGLVAALLGVTLLLVGADYLLRLPGPARLVLLAGGLAGLGWALWKSLVPALRFRPGLTDLALRAEATFPAVAGRLASSVEFAVAGLDAENPLAARSVADAERRMAGESLRRMLSGRRTWRAVGACAGALAVAGTCAALDPASARTGLLRLFAPLGSAEWPARTAVVSLMDEIVPETRVHPRGQALPLRARVTRGNVQEVGARYRLEADGALGPWRRIVLTPQGRGIHERLVDTSADAIELYFETQDARTERERIALAAPPAVRRAALTVTPPPYAAEWFSPLQADLGPGLDQRSMTEAPSLAGSEVTLVLEFNKPLPVPGGPEDLARILGWGEGRPPALSAEGPRAGTWTLAWRLAETRALNLRLADEHGLTNTDVIAYRIDAVEDRLPAVTIIEPEADEPVLASAVVPLSAESRDDVAVASMGLEAAGLRGGPSAAEEPLWQTSQVVHAPAGTLPGTLDLGPMGLSPGDVVLVRATASDVFELDGLRHPVVRSAPRRLQIIGAIDLARMLRRELSTVRQNAIRIEARQAELEDDVIAEGPQPGVDRAQAQVGERIAGQRESIDGLRRRLEMNRLGDEQLAALVQRSADLLDFAGRAATQATEAIEARQAAGRAAENRPGEPAPRPAARPAPADRAPGTPGTPGAPRDPGAAGGDAPEPGEAADLEALSRLVKPEAAEEDRSIVEAQREVREELADLITLLDRDEDAWVATRRLEELLDRQTGVAAETGAAGQRTLGRSREELNRAEQAELERLSQQQTELGEQARQLIEDLRRRAAELQDTDPQGAGAMRAAAERGERGELSRDMESASEQLERNQMQAAGSSQQSARRTMEQMLGDMRETTRASAEELLRRLASLIESIERLIAVQEHELAALRRGIDGAGEFTGRDRAMIRLAQNTQSVAADARAAGQESRRIARLLDRAADAQGAAVVALRALPADGERALEGETRSLDLLREARSLAEELERAVEEREVLRQREEVVEAYRRLAERQLAVRGETLRLAGAVPLDRRALVEARGLGRAEEEIRGAMHDLGARTPELMEAAMFAHVHAQVDRWCSSAGESLIAGDVGTAVTDRQQRIADSIARLAGSLEELIVPPDRFAGGAGQQGGGQGAAGPTPLIPPVAELMLLRGMQEQVNEQTTDVDRRADLDAPQRHERLAELGDEQRELLRLGREMAEALRQGPPPAEPEEAAPPPQEDGR